jgi:hypothetical protein
MCCDNANKLPCYLLKQGFTNQNTFKRFVRSHAMLKIDDFLSKKVFFYSFHLFVTKI